MFPCRLAGIKIPISKEIRYQLKVLGSIEEFYIYGDARGITSTWGLGVVKCTEADSTRQRKTMIDLGRISIGIVLSMAIGGSAWGETLFYASFDHTCDADVAVGHGTGYAGNGGRLFELTPGERGPWGLALNAYKPRKGRGLRYDSVGNIDLNRGTVEFFARLDDFGEGWSSHRFFTFTGIKTFALGIGRRADGMGLVLGYDWNGRSVWDPHAEKFVEFNRWQHYAVTWDMSVGKGKGTLSVFVDGTRRLHTTDLDPFIWGVESLLVGGPQKLWGYIDDFVIFDDVRYEQDFMPRQKPLGELDPTAVARVSKSTAVASRDQISLGHLSLKNADFEQWKEGDVVGWNVGRGMAFADDTKKMTGRRSLRLQVDPKDEMKWPYSHISSEPLILEPDSSYKFSLWMAQAKTVGDIKINILASDGSVCGSYSSGWSPRFPWLYFEVPFLTNDCSQYYIDISVVLGHGWSTWFDDIKIIKQAGAPRATPTEQDFDLGFQLFNRSVMKSYGIELQPPSAAETIDLLHIGLGRGEYEPTLLGLYAFAHLEGVDVRLTGDLTGPGNAKIPAEDVVVRRLEGALLPFTQPRPVDAKGILAWWVTAKTDKTCQPGVYHGELQISVAGDVVRRLPFEVDVMDLELPVPEVAFWVYHHEAYFQSRFLTPDLQKAYFRDMVEHGMNTVTVYNNADVDGNANVDFAHNYGYNRTDPQFDYGFDTTVPWILESGLCSEGQPLFWLPSRDSTDGGLAYGWGMVPENALKASLEQWQQRGWPEPLLYVGDEPGSDTGMVPRLKMIKSWNLNVRLTTAGIDSDALGEYYDVWIHSDRGITLAELEKANALEAELWQYNYQTPYENMPFPRAFYGFYAFRTGVKGAASWAYYDNKDWYADADGNVHGHPRTRLSRVCVSPNGPIPTLGWEATREGVDDYRYAQMMRDLVAEAEQRVKEMTSKAKAILSEDDRQQIDERERRRVGYWRNPEAPAEVVNWKAPNESKAQGERIYLAAKQLEISLERAQQTMIYVIQSIPFDACVARIPAIVAGRSSLYCPPLGPLGVGEDPITMTENKRRVLASYILALQTALEESS